MVTKPTPLDQLRQHLADTQPLLAYFCTRAKESERAIGSYHLRELDVIALNKLFELAQNEPDARAELNLAVSYIYNITPPR